MLSTYSRGVAVADFSGDTPDRYSVIGVPVSIVNPVVAFEYLLKWSGQSIGRMVFVRDVHGVMLARDDAELMQLHHEADMITPDGMPLVWLARRKGLPVSRTSGPDLLPYVISNPRGKGLRHFFLGGKPGVAQELSDKFAGVGATSPPFHDLSQQEIDGLAAQIAASGADIVWVGLSTPKQEKLMARLRPLVPATLIGVGAAFDFHTGRVKRAPRWMRETGFEWMFRLLQEPRRLWRRYLVIAPRFVFALLVSALRRT